MSREAERAKESRRRWVSFSNLCRQVRIRSAFTVVTRTYTLLLSRIRSPFMLDRRFRLGLTREDFVRVNERRGRSRTVCAIGLAAFLVPLAFTGTAKLKAQGIACLNNHRQLTLAWLMYAHDSNDRSLFANPLWNGTGRDTSWMGGELDFNPANRSSRSSMRLPRRRRRKGSWIFLYEFDSQ